MSEHTISLVDLASIRDGTGHTIFSPSSSAMWLTCSGSLIPNLLAPDDAGEDAAYGTVAHELTEDQLKTGRVPVDRLGEEVAVRKFKIPIDEDMLRHVQTAVDYCEWMPGDQFTERRVFFSQYTPLKNQSGTSDFANCEPGKLTITDHKFGKGVKVFAAMDYDDPRCVIINDIDDTFELNGNSQGLLYALGFFLEYDWMYDFQEIVIRISQPRLDHFDEWRTTRKHLMEFAEFVRRRSHDAWKLNAPRRASTKGCEWCKVKADCPTWAVMYEGIVSGAMDVPGEADMETVEELKSRLDDPIDGYKVPFADAMKLTTQQLETILTFRRASENWFKKIEETLKQRAREGTKLGQWKLVATNTHRVFRPGAVKKLLALPVPTGRKPIKREELVQEAVVSPAEAERILATHGFKPAQIETLFADLTARPPGQPTLARSNDKRPPLADLTEDVFTDASEDF
ncbi:hypothetical protein D3C87_959370 [compost metagenome]